MAGRTSYFARRACGSFAAASAIALLLPLAVQAQESGASSELTARMAKEKEDRKACKIEICKAFAAPSDGSVIGCTVTKTWLAADIQAGFLGDKLTCPGATRNATLKSSSTAKPSQRRRSSLRQP